MDDLPHELGRLETKVGEGAPDSRVIDELAAVRGELSRPAGSAPFRLANLRVASPCRERWADMLGDDRARVCNGCDRPVFNLSEMTRDQAEAVLATRGIKPCVRFYRRADGTVMTADCPTTPRRSRRLTVLTAGTLLGASPAMADPDPASEVTPTPETTPTQEDDNVLANVFSGDDGWTMGDIAEPPLVKRAAVEWSTWARIGYGIGSRPPTFAARATTPLTSESPGLGDGALGLDVSFAVAHRGAVRLGAFVEVRTVSGPVLGGELIVGGFPSRHYGDGSTGIVLRGGGNSHVVTGALGVGYAATDPWFGFHHATGVRIITSMTRSVEDPRDWSVTLGLEVDPIGAIGYLVRR